MGECVILLGGERHAAVVELTQLGSQSELLKPQKSGQFPDELKI